MKYYFNKREIECKQNRFQINQLSQNLLFFAAFCQIVSFLNILIVMIRYFNKEYKFSLIKFLSLINLKEVSLERYFYFIMISCFFENKTRFHINF